jgi:hypothetical protein
MELMFFLSSTQVADFSVVRWKYVYFEVSLSVSNNKKMAIIMNYLIILCFIIEIFVQFAKMV